MPDPYALSADRQTGTEHQPAPRHPARALLWVLLVLSVAGNAITSFGVVPLAVSLALGVVTAASAITLISLYVRRQP